MISRKERLELDALSKEVFGSSSRWQKLVLKGHPEMVTEEKVETVPATSAGEDPVEKKVQVPVAYNNGKNAYQFTTKHYTVESVKAYMVAQKIQMDEIRAMLAKQQEEAKAAKEAERVAKEAELKAQQINNQMGGSAV